jgi:hypothetical protein
VVLNGNGRLAGALGLNWSHIAVNYVDLDDADAAELAITLNRTGELASWHQVNLAIAMKKMKPAPDPVLDKLMADLAKEKHIFEPAPPPTPPPSNRAGAQTITCPNCGQLFAPAVP